MPTPPPVPPPYVPPVPPQYAPPQYAPPQYAPPQYAPPAHRYPPPTTPPSAYQYPPPAATYPIAPYPVSGPPPHARPRRRGPRVALASLVTTLLVAAGLVAGRAAFDDGVVHPERWDPRVAALARFVEQARGLRFEHPVSVYFLSPEKYTEASTGGSDLPEPTPEDRRTADRAVAQYRSLGLMEGSPDLFAASSTLQDSGTLAFYSPEADVVNVRGTELTPAVRVTLVHELTHALQDQHFDLGAIGNSASADQAGAARAVVEGDAVAVENVYVESLSDPDRAAYETESQQSGDAASTDLESVPEVMQVLFGSYYAVGNAFVEYVRADPTGPDASNVDPVLRDLPSGSNQLFEPEAYQPGAEPLAVDPPDARPGSEEFERGTHGVDFLYVMLSERIDPRIALAATDGWRGDTYVAATDETGQVCVSTRVQLVDATQANEFRDAIVRWKAAMPPAAGASVESFGGDQGDVTFRSCDPGPDADMQLTGQAGPALGYPVVRLQAAAGAIANGRSAESARCYGQALVDRLTLGDLQSDDRTPAIDAAITAATAACP